MAIPSDANARKYYRVAKQRLSEAQILVKNELWAAAIYLTGYSIECVLKSLLITLTPKNQRANIMVSMRDDFGHSLRRLRAGVIARGARIPATVASHLLFASTWSPDLRYEPGPGDPAEAARFLSAAKVVMAWADGRIS